VVHCVWKKYVVWCEVEVVWRRGKVMVVVMMKPRPNQCRVLWKHRIWVSGLFPSFGILENRKHDILETGSSD
jgi:hypothetical protein